MQKKNNPTLLRILNQNMKGRMSEKREDMKKKDERKASRAALVKEFLVAYVIRPKNQATTLRSHLEPRVNSHLMFAQTVLGLERSESNNRVYTKWVDQL